MSEEPNVTPEVAAPVESTEAAPVPEAAAPSFLDSLPEDLRGDASLANFKDSASLAKSYIHAQKMMGSSIRIPSEDTSPEATAEFYEKLQSIDGVVRIPQAEDVEGFNALYNKLGRPESPTEYKLNEGIQTDPEQFSQFAELAHKAGMTNEQMNVVMGFEQARQAQEAEAYNQNVENSERILREKWGNDYTARLDGARAAAATYAEMYPEAMQELVEGPAGNNPALLAMLSELQGTMVEKGSAGKHASTPYGTSAEEAKFKIEEIKSNPSHAYRNPADPKHQEALNRMSELYEIAYPSQR